MADLTLRDEELGALAGGLHSLACSRHLRLIECDHAADYFEDAYALAPLIARMVADAEARALREAAEDPALRLSGHSGISIRRLRDRADRIGGAR